MNTLLHDLRYALRQLRKSPGFTLTVVLTLALGIGANAAVFTVFDQVLLRMLPVERPKELVRFVWSGDFSGSSSSFGGGMYNYFSYPMYKDLRDQTQVFAGMLAADRANVGVSWRNQAENEDAEVVSGNYFQLLGLKPVLGRLLTPQDDSAKNANPVLVLSFNYWKTRFAASRDVVGQKVLINGHSFTILGVAPENFQSAIGGYKPGVFVPISMVEVAMPWMAPRDDLNNHQSLWLTLVARLKPGMTIPKAEASMGPLWHSLRAYELTLYKARTERFKKNFLDNSQIKVVDDATGFSPDRMELTTPLVILMSMAGLLIAMCAINVATLLLLRAAGRAREMSMRYALGAKRSRIVSQLLVEGGLLGLAGAIAGLALAPVVATTLVRLMTNSDPGREPYSSSIDAHVLLFTLGVALVVSLLFSIAPVLSLSAPRSGQHIAPECGNRVEGLAAIPQAGGGRADCAQRDAARRRGSVRAHARQSPPSIRRIRHQPSCHLLARSHQLRLRRRPHDADHHQALDELRRIPGVTNALPPPIRNLRRLPHSSFTLQGYKTAEDETCTLKMSGSRPATPPRCASLCWRAGSSPLRTPRDSRWWPSSIQLWPNATTARSKTRWAACWLKGAAATSHPDTTIVGVVGE